MNEYSVEIDKEELRNLICDAIKNEKKDVKIYSDINGKLYTESNINNALVWEYNPKEDYSPRACYGEKTEEDVLDSIMDCDLVSGVKLANEIIEKEEKRIDDVILCNTKIKAHEIARSIYDYFSVVRRIEFFDGEFEEARKEGYDFIIPTSADYIEHIVENSDYFVIQYKDYSHPIFERLTIEKLNFLKEAEQFGDNLYHAVLHNMMVDIVGECEFFHADKKKKELHLMILNI